MSRSLPSRISLSIILTLLALPVMAAGETRIAKVELSAPSFNPAVGQTVGIRVTASAPGRLKGIVVDRDGFLVRELVDRSVQSGVTAMEWDGKDADGRSVADEAYSFRFDLQTANGSDRYFPADTPGKFLTIQAHSYDPVAGVLRYTLPEACRVHIQAGTAVFAPKTNAAEGPVLKTIVNRAPRAGGSVVEHWVGLDDSGTIRVKDLPNFVVAIAATPLPENAVITFGNRKESFAATLGRRRGTSLLKTHVHSHAHHQGLQAADDITPELHLSLVNGSWSPSGKLWKLNGDKARVTVKLGDMPISTFARQPARVIIFVDGRKVLDVPAADAQKELTVNLPAARSREHVLAVNWVSDYGPVAVAAVRLHRSTNS